MHNIIIIHSRCVIEKPYCLKYETWTGAYADSTGEAEVETILSNDSKCNIRFLLSENKTKGDHKMECHDVTCPAAIDLPMSVRIRQNSSDGWGIDKMQVQRYPGSSEFITYSLNGSTQFWVDGDGGYDGDDFPACEDAKWCNLDVQGNPFHLIIISPNILIILIEVILICC